MKTIEQLQAENDALAAQVEALTAHRSALATAASMATVALPIGSAVTDFCVEAVKRFNVAKETTPQKHLAEVKAQAGRAGFVAGYLLCNDGSALIKHNYEGFADKYASSIRQEQHSTWLRDSNVNGGRRKGEVE